jgi:hypothetical protein
MVGRNGRGLEERGEEGDQMGVRGGREVGRVGGERGTGLVEES